MATRPRHARASRRRPLLRAGLTLTAAGAAALAGAATAQAGVVDQVGGAVEMTDPASALSSVGHAVVPVTELQLNPLAKTGVDPLDNGVNTQVADFPSVGTDTVTAPLAAGASLSDLAEGAAGPLLSR